MEKAMALIGEMVHYVAFVTPGGEFPSGVCRAATITEIDGETLLAGICVQHPTGLFFNREISYWANLKEKKAGTWHFPGACDKKGQCVG